MDVSKPDGHSDAVKFVSGSPTGAAVTATNGIDPAGLGGNGKKKAKKKNKAKNSSSGEVIEMAAKESRDVVNTRALTNGTQETIAIDAISRQFEQCVQLNRNGLTNGAPVAPPKDLVNGSTGPSGNGSGAGGGSKKNKHRSKQSKSGIKASPGDVAVSGEYKSTQDTANRINNNTLELITDGSLQVAEQPTEQRKDRGREDGDGGDCGSSTPSTISTSLSSSPGSGTSECKVKQQQSPPPNLPFVDGEGTISSVPSQELKLAPDPDPVPPATQIDYKVYESERQMPFIMALIQKDLSEPYSIYTYRYFIHNWPKLCFLALHGDVCVGAIVCKLDFHRQNIRRGYIAMLAVDKDYRKMKIGTTLVQKAIQAMLEFNADEVVLETEITNQPALRLYENLGFVRDKRLFHYYLNGVDALRLKLWFT